MNEFLPFEKKIFEPTPLQRQNRKRQIVLKQAIKGLFKMNGLQIYETKVFKPLLKVNLNN